MTECYVSGCVLELLTARELLIKPLCPPQALKVQGKDWSGHMTRVCHKYDTWPQNWLLEIAVSWSHQLKSACRGTFHGSK